MNYIIGIALLIAVIVIFAGAYSIAKIKNENIFKNHFNELYQVTDETQEEENYNDVPVDKNVLLDSMNILDRRQEERATALLRCLEHIEFWITIIGVYFLIKFIILFICIFTLKDGLEQLQKLI